jgi:ATP synthase protein I
MARVVALQFVAALIIALLAFLLGGLDAGVSALFGGLCCAIPNGLFAVRLYVGTLKPGGANPMTFFFGEFTKIILTIALMAAVVYLYHNVNWLAFLVAFILVLKSYFILLFRQSS